MKRIAAVLLALTACSRSAPPAPADTPAPAGTPAPADTSASAGTPAPSGTPAPAASPAASAPPAAAPAATPVPSAATGPGELPVTAASATVAAREQPLARAAVTIVDPGAQFHVEVPLALADARLSLLDAEGAMVPATGGAEFAAERTRFHLAPDAPLVPGSSYTLKLDGAVERNPRDPGGRSWAAASWALLTTGEKPKAAPKKQKEHRRRHR